MRAEAKHPQASSPSRRARTASLRADVRVPPLASLAFLAVSVLALLLAPPTLAAEEHRFDPTLSLGGSCETTKLDTVPDPGVCPGTLGVDHPPQPFNHACGVATDSNGYIYVASGPEGEAARIDVFKPDGTYVTEVGLGEIRLGIGCPLAVDSAGRIYIPGHLEPSWMTPAEVFRFSPNFYPPTPAAGYGTREECVSSGVGEAEGVAIDPTNDHLYVSNNGGVKEFETSASGCKLLENVLTGPQIGHAPADVDVWHRGAQFQIYVSYTEGPTGAGVKVFEGAPPHALEQEVKRAGESVNGSTGLYKLSVEQEAGDFYLTDVELENVELRGINHFCRDGAMGGFTLCEHIRRGDLAPGADVAVDSSPASPNQGHVFYTATHSPSHLYAFKPKTAAPPAISEQRVTQVATTSATLRGEVNSEGLDTTYRFEYMREADFQANGWKGAIRLGEGELGAAEPATAVSAPISQLEPGTAYRFRIVATNVEGTTAGEGVPGTEGEAARFATYPEPFVAGLCPNEALRTGASAALPDCRAYELVTPPDMGGHAPTWTFAHYYSATRDTELATASGESLLFASVNGSLPGLPGNGWNAAYEAVRDEAAGRWETGLVGPTGEEARQPYLFQFSPDHRYSTWWVFSYVPGGDPPGGSLDRGCDSYYLHLSHSTFEPIGLGSLGDVRGALPSWLTAGASHLIFTTESSLGCGDERLQLEPEAPPSGTSAVYDRRPGGPTHVVSLLPGDVTPSANAGVWGVPSADGSVVPFTVGGGPVVYARIDDERTLGVTESTATFAGISAHGDRVFYLKGGDLFVCDLGVAGCTGEGSHAPIQIGTGGETTPVNISADGSHAYFSSPVVLSGTGENENGERAKAGRPNLYSWNGSSVTFVAILDPADLTLEEDELKEPLPSLARWMESAARHENGALDPSRTTPDGHAIIFESRARLTAYDNAGHTEVYRYDANAPAGRLLSCVSCNPTLVSAGSDASLQTLLQTDTTRVAPIEGGADVANLTADGEAVFFQSAERLVAADHDGVTDVYEWRAHGSGGCERQGGCLALISSGQSSFPSYLYAVTPSGHDVFIDTVDGLTFQDTDGGSLSLYDARVDGGFPEPPPTPAECLGEACQPAAAPFNDLTPSSLAFTGPGNMLLQPVVKPKAKPTNAQKLARALKACRKKTRKAQRKRCEARARKRYGTQAKKKAATGARRASSHRRAAR